MVRLAEYFRAINYVASCRLHKSERPFTEAYLRFGGLVLLWA